jgi:hypothetical protein
MLTPRSLSNWSPSNYPESGVCWPYTPDKPHFRSDLAAIPRFTFTFTKPIGGVSTPMDREAHSVIDSPCTKPNGSPPTDA